MNTPDSFENALEHEQETQERINNNNQSCVNEIEERKRYVQDFINKSFQHFKRSLDFGYIHDQDMNYYQEHYNYNDTYERPMLGPNDDDSKAGSNGSQDYDPDYDNEVNRLLAEVEEEILQESSNPATEENSRTENDSLFAEDSKRIQYEDCYNEFSEDMHHVGPVPTWYNKMLEKKMSETKHRLGNLSNLVCYVCKTTGDHIKRIEQDHNTVFCKMDFPRHPPLNKPWTNFWKFNCVTKCKDINKPNHAHTSACATLILEHATTGVSTLSQNISENEYPKFVMNAVELFQDFAVETTKNVPYSDPLQYTDTVYEKPTWTEIKLRSNYKNELMIVVRGKGVTLLIPKLKKYYNSGPGRTSNVISVYCTNQKCSQKKGNFHPAYVTGIFKLRDKVGPISINYEPKTSMTFNSVEAIQLGKLIQDYASLTNETTLLDIGCNFGVLSLMLSHKCDRVIGLNTMHFVNSDINQAEESKKYNKIHNVSFVACDPKDILTKCSTLVKRCITVAVLNLSSPYGKSAKVIQALRDLPSIWKVIAYGTFTKEFHRNISLLVSKDDTMGEHFLPMQYCILDKSPTVEDAFDIVILFERKSLITTKIELLAPGPTLNIKTDSEYDYGSLDSQIVRPVLKIEKGFGKSGFRPKKFGDKPFNKYRAQLYKYGNFDSPMLPMDKEQPEKKRISPTQERKFDCSVLTQNNPPDPPTTNDRKKVGSLTIRKEFQINDWKPIYDSPSLPMPKEEEKPARNDLPSSPAKSFDSSVLRKQPVECSDLRKQEGVPEHSKRKPSPRPFISVKKEFRYSCPTPPREIYSSPPPPREKYPSPPPPPPTPPPTEQIMLDTSQIKTEKNTTDVPITTVKAEPMDLNDEKEEGELSAEDDHLTNVPIKSEKIDTDYFVGSNEVDSQNKTETVAVKTEPEDSHETVSQSVAVKNEPEDMQISPISDDIANMKTPIHNPRALSDTLSSPLPGSTKFTTLDGFKFSVNAMDSFLPLKSKIQDPELSNAASSIKKEEREENDIVDSDDEIKIVDEKLSSVNANQNRKNPDQRLNVKSLDEIIHVKSDPDQNDDLRTLIEQRKELQRKLDRASETSYYKESNRRTPSPDMSRQYRKQTSPSSPPPSKKYNRSPSPRRSYRSPSPRRSYRSPSPRKSYRSPSPRKYYRSPSPSIRFRSPGRHDRKYKRSPPSPSRTWDKRERSPGYKRSRRSPSPIERRYRRSPSSPIRYKREAYSPSRFKRDPLSPSYTRSKRSPSSASSLKSDIYGRSRSPGKSRRDIRRRRSRSRSPIERERRRRSLSPTTMSPSPPRKQRERYDDYNSYKKKRKDRSKSKSPSRSYKKKSKTSSRDALTSSEIKYDSSWDIPVLSSPEKIANPADNEINAEGTIKVEPTQDASTEATVAM